MARRGLKPKVNIDAGYIDHCKLVLASGKFGGHKIALTDECYAYMIIDYQKGSFQPFPWCFPDFRGGIYNKDLLKIRALLKTNQGLQLRQLSKKFSGRSAFLLIYLNCFSGAISCPQVLHFCILNSTCQRGIFLTWSFSSIFI